MRRDDDTVAGETTDLAQAGPDTGGAAASEARGASAVEATPDAETDTPAPTDAPEADDAATPQPGAEGASAADATPDAADADPVSEADAADAAGDTGADMPATDTGADEEKPFADTASGEDQAPERPAPPQTVHVVERRGGFGTALLAGLIAAALGFAAARTTVLDPVLPAALRSRDASEAVAALQAAQQAQAEALAETRAKADANTPPDLGPLEARLAELSTQTGALETELSDLSAQVAPLTGAVDGLNDRAGALQSRIEALDTRLTALEKQPLDQAVSDAAVAAYERELAAIQEQIEAQRAEVSALHERELAAIKATVAEQRAEVQALVDEARALEAQAAALEAKASEDARLAEQRAIAVRLRAALDEGSAFAAIVQDLDAAGVAVPGALTDTAETGVATMAALREGFPDAARAALAAARQETRGSGDWLAFLHRQLGARSVTPREGDDPDAVLSRAEAALTDGRLGAALDEIAALPEPARAAMAEWVADATERQEAAAAADSLVQSLNTN